jgi:hypothetical protein
MEALVVLARHMLELEPALTTNKPPHDSQVSVSSELSLIIRQAMRHGPGVPPDPIDLFFRQHTWL